MQTIEKAITLFQGGDVAAAECACRKILARHGRNFPALYVLALAAMQTGRNQEAERRFGQALAVNGRSVEAWANRGNNFIALRRPEAALDSFDRALKLAPGFVEVHYNRAKLLDDGGHLADALAGYDACLALEPRFASALHNRGVVLARLGRHAEALASFDHCLALMPNAADTLNNRGAALANLGRDEEALASYGRSLALAPNTADTLTNRGDLLAKLQRYDEALACYDASLALAPTLPKTLHHRGDLLAALNRFDEAHESYRRCLALAPGHAGAWASAARAMMQAKRYTEAIEAIRNLLAIEPKDGVALSYLVQAKLCLCDWDGLDNLVAQLIERIRDGTAVAVPFYSLLIPTTPDDQLACARRFLSREAPVQHPPLRGIVPYQHDRIRLAYLSADFHEHAMGLLLAGVFERHDRTRFETIGISFSPNSAGETQRRIRTAFERFIDVREMTDRDAAKAICALEVDIAVDVMGFTAGSRTEILAWRPAPIQVNYLGYPGTMGTECIDYIIADPCVIPPTERACYAEKVVYLPDSYQANDDRRDPTEPLPQRTAVGLPEQGFVFCCFNQTAKIMPDVFDIWMRLLRHVDGSVLWLMAENSTAQANIFREAAKRGVMADRIVFAERTTPARHLARQVLADLVLDTLPYNAHVTASDALLAGVPIVTCAGKTFAGRVAASLLGAVGLPELVTTSLADYEAVALRIATDPPLLAALKAKLADNRPTAALFDTARITRNLEAAYETMYQRRQRGEPPEHFMVGADTLRVRAM